MKKLAALAIILFGLSIGALKSGVFAPEVPQVSSSTAAGDAQLARAYEERRSSVQVQAAGTVKKVLRDDNDGSRHQRFILELSTGQTLLVAHNIDLAPRVENLRRGDRVEFSGEYEWSQQGGVIHWTHRDPKEHHIDGWIRHKGKFYW